MENPDADVREGVVLEIRTHPGTGGWVVIKPEIVADILCRRPLPLLLLRYSLSRAQNFAITEH